MVTIRTSQRHAVTIQGTCRAGTEPRRPISLLDISEDGCRFFETQSRLKIGQSVSLGIQQIGPFEATVVWKDDALVGVRFAKPMYGPIFDHIRNQLDNPEWRPEPA